MTNNILITSLKYVAKDLIGDFLYWPVWWYSKGLLNTIQLSLRSIKNQQETLGVSIWIKNLFTPMYGQYDWEGRLISFVIRFIQIIFRIILLIVWIILSIIPIVIWITIPAIVIIQIYLNFVNLLV